MKRRLASLVMSLVMVLSLFPVNTMAAVSSDTDTPAVEEAAEQVPQEEPLTPVEETKEEPAIEQVEEAAAAEEEMPLLEGKPPIVVETSAGIEGYSTIDEAWASATDAKVATITLLNDATATNTMGNIDSGSTITLDLNGHVLNLNNKGNVTNRGNLIVVSGDTTTPHIFSTSTNVWMLSETGNYTVKGGVITGGTATGNGGFINVTAGATLHAEHVNFVGNSAEYGGVIYNGGTVELTDCAAYGNTAESGGAYYSGAALTISGGDLRYNKATTGVGGAVCVSGGTMAAAGVTFSNNAADIGGGAIGTDGYTSVTLSLADCTISGNESCNSAKDTGGGGVFVGANAKLDAANTQFIGNSAKNFGGAMTCTGAATLTNCTVTNNKTEKSGGAFCIKGYASTAIIGGSVANNTAAAYGGALYLNSSYASFTAKDVTFTGNKAKDQSGGAVYAQSGTCFKAENVTFNNNEAGGNGGGAYFESIGALTLTNCDFTDNAAKWGGGIHVVSCAASTISNMTATGNTAEYTGGGVYLSFSNATLTDCTITGNTAANTADSADGGGLYADGGSYYISGTAITGNTSNNYGGGIYCGPEAVTTLHNCTVTGNKAEEGAGIMVPKDEPTLILSGNSTVTGNTVIGSTVCSNLYLEDDTIFHVSGFTGTIGITQEKEVTYSTPRVLTSSYTDVKAGAKLSSDVPAYLVRHNAATHCDELVTRITGVPTVSNGYKVTVDTTTDGVVTPTYQWYEKVETPLTGVTPFLLEEMYCATTTNMPEGKFASVVGDGYMLYLKISDANVKTVLFTSTAAEIGEVLTRKTLTPENNVYTTTTGGQKEIGANILALACTDAPFTIENLKSLQVASVTDATGAALTAPEDGKTYFCRITIGDISYDSPVVMAPSVANVVATFDSNGGTPVASQTIVQGGKAVAPTAPTRAGSKFAGWYLNGVAYNFNAPVIDNITLTARWLLTENETSETTVSSDGTTSTKIQVVGYDGVKASGLEEIAKDIKTGNADKNVKVELTVKEITKTAANTAEVNAIQQAAGSKTLALLDVDLTKYINGANDGNITDTAGKVIEVLIPFDASSKKDITPYRYHAGDAIPATAFINTQTGADGSFYIEGSGANAVIHLFTTKFSTYAIGYTPVSTGSASGKSTASSGYTITSDFKSITKVTVDGKTVDSKYYTVSGGNVTLTDSYLKTLTNGKHSVKLENATHIATAAITVKNSTVKSAATGDMGIVLYAGMAIASLLGTGYVTGKRKEF